MAGRQLGRLAARLLGSANPSTARERAAEFARTLKEQYEAGLRGDPDVDAPPDGADTTDDPASAEEVAAAMRGVDWASVRQATAKGTSEAAERMRAMASNVDWEKVQPVAAQVSSALIAAVASGQIPVGGPLGGRVLRTIMNDHGLAQRVATSLAPTPQAMPDFRPDLAGAVEAQHREAPGQST
jgi:hypothetical protein